MKAGEILLVNYPFTDDSGSKLRPALVVSAERYNFGNDIVVVPISSQPHSDLSYAEQVSEKEPWFRSTGLKRTSFVKWTKPITLSKQLASRRLGRMPEELLSRIHDNLRGLFSAA